MSIESPEKNRWDEPVRAKGFSGGQILGEASLGEIGRRSDHAPLGRLPGLELLGDAEKPVQTQNVAELDIQKLSATVGKIVSPGGVTGLLDLTQNPPKLIGVVGADGKPIRR